MKFIARVPRVLLFSDFGTALAPRNVGMPTIRTTISRRFQRMRRRRKVGRAYDMALEIARVLKPRATVLDVGCGNGFIAHHLTGLLKSRVIGLDVTNFTSASIDYVPYDGRHFPVRDGSVDAVLLCYVLHHAKDAALVLNEVRRVLTKDGRVIVYEDSPSSWWDRAVCWSHSLQWQGRTGHCTFQLESEWQGTFLLSGFKVVSRRGLSRWRNIAHPVSRNFFVLEIESNNVKEKLMPGYEVASVPLQHEIHAGT
jgi:SAM-dependent methyltransferase